jgi:hypothetical protein
MITEITYMAVRNALSCMKRRYEDMMAILVKAIAKAYNTWHT